MSETVENQPQKREKSNLSLRVIGASIYIAFLVAFFCVKVFVKPDLLGMVLFDILVALFSVIGTVEMIQAFGDKLITAQKVTISLFGTGSIICYSVSDFLFRYWQIMPNYSPNFAFVVFIAGIAILFSFLVFGYTKVDLDSLGRSVIAYLYPSAFLLVLSGINHMPDVPLSEMGILFAFIICPMADTFAFFFGKLFGKKLPMKMAPNISPNKTMIGGLGGLLGGAIGGLGIYFIYNAIRGTFLFDWNIIFYIGLGVLTAGFAEFGDLVESAVKRRLGKKDMGKILPGHGGILDRIDSALFASLIICFVLVLRIITR